VRWEAQPSRNGGRSKTNELFLRLFTPLLCKSILLFFARARDINTVYFFF
jgi:hypothetical protein